MFAEKKKVFNAVSTTGWNDPELLKEWRRAWTEKVNEKFRECYMAARTLADMDRAVSNFKRGDVSLAIDLSDF